MPDSLPMTFDVQHPGGPLCPACAVALELIIPPRGDEFFLCPRCGRRQLAITIRTKHAATDFIYQQFKEQSRLQREAVAHMAEDMARRLDEEIMQLILPYRRKE